MEPKQLTIAWEIPDTLRGKVTEYQVRFFPKESEALAMTRYTQNMNFTLTEFMLQTDYVFMVSHCVGLLCWRLFCSWFRQTYDFMVNAGSWVWEVVLSMVQTGYVFMVNAGSCVWEFVLFMVQTGYVFMVNAGSCVWEVVLSMVQTGYVFMVNTGSCVWEFFHSTERLFFFIIILLLCFCRVLAVVVVAVDDADDVIGVAVCVTKMLLFQQNYSLE